MTSTAKQAKGTKVAIAGTPGSAITITAITLAKPAVVTASNSLAVGDVVVFGAITGMPEMQGRIGIVTVASGSSFTVNIDSTSFSGAGTAGAATPQTWNEIANVKDFNAFTGQVTEIDTTNLKSLAKEFQPGLEDFGSMTFNVDLDNADAGQLALMVNKSASATTYFRLIYPNASVIRASQGFVKKFDEQGKVDGVYMSAVEIRFNGRVSRQEVVN